MTPPPVSEESYQLSPILTDCVGVAVRVGGERVTTEPVDVYIGRSDTAAPAFEMVAGGHAAELAALADIVPAPAPPVCHDLN